MGREQRANEERRAAIRQARDDAHRAFVQSFAVLSGALGVSVILTEPTGKFDGQGVPEGQTREFTVYHATPEIGLSHMLQGSGLLYESHNKLEREVIAYREKQAADQAEKLPTPEGMEEEPAVDPTKALDLLKDEAEETPEEVEARDRGRENDDEANRKAWDDEEGGLEVAHEETCLSLKGGVCDC